MAFIREAIPKIGQKKASAFGCRRFFVGIKKNYNYRFETKEYNCHRKETAVNKQKKPSKLECFDGFNI